jgi:hypothetical protein
MYQIYFGPSGRFQPHVDTPRSQHQFGSLVVCLPVEHEGGQLKVRYKGKEFTFDWSTAKAMTTMPPFVGPPDTAIVNMKDSQSPGTSRDPDI